MAELPRGTVAFLMTDIEGSTRLVRDLGPAFADLLGDHFAIMQDAISADGGILVSTEGDSVFAVFRSVREAVRAAVAAQRALAAQEWPQSATVKVRMGVHVGEAVMGGRDYTGLEVHRVARIMAAGHGGQILVSGSARALAADPGDGIGFRELGVHQLRDMPAPEELYQTLAPGLTTDFPPLRTESATVPTNLPTPMTRFVGRAAEVAGATARLADSRLLTLTGPGGTGKTRLSIEVARASVAHYPDGVWFVGLDVVRDPALVLAAIATTLGVQEMPGRSPAALVAERLASKQTLLVLDNLEQVIAAAADVAALLDAVPGLTVLATSREPLAVAGEVVLAVPPLTVPDEPGAPTAAFLADNDCVALFVERARAARADFALTNANAAAVAAICRRLDGLPLALELAAARINVLSPDQILARMDHRLTLLSSSRRDLTDRQRTLRGAIEWSYDLLAEPERAFFRRFSVFSGGADFEAAQAVIDPDGNLGADALELASSLVDRSLLRSTQRGDDNRLEILETLREFAADRLAVSPEEHVDATGRHIIHFRTLAEVSEGVLTDPLRDEILDRLDRELPNFRAAIASSIATGDISSGARIGTALRDFWHARAHLLEGRRLLGTVIDASAGDEPSADRARLILTAGETSSWSGDYAEAGRLSKEGLAMAEAAGARDVTALALMGLGWSTFMRDPAYASEQFAAAIAIAREIGDDNMLRGALQGYGVSLLGEGQLEAARAAVEESMAIADRVGDRYINAFNLVCRGFIEARSGNLATAFRDHRQSLRDSYAAGAAVGIALAVDSVALDEFYSGEPVRAATLAAGGARLRAEVGGGPTTALAGAREALDLAKAELAPNVFAAAVSTGGDLSVEDLVALALRDDDAATRGETAGSQASPA